MPGDEAAGERGIPFENTYDEDGDPIFEYCFMGPLPLCPGFVDQRPAQCEVKQESFGCTNCPQAIPQAGQAPLALAAVVNREDCVVGDVNITLDIQHTWIGDLDIAVSSPLTANVPVVQDICDTGPVANLQAVLDSDAAQTIGSVCPPTPFAAVRPGGAGVDVAALDAFDRQNATGEWVLDVFDDVGGDQGTITNWSVDITYR